uniref:Uncharacterized protein n=1 Tax=Cacopsylla melanoneura TaxID=428564 RepID=A0A8D9DSN9_9HEMI
MLDALLEVESWDSVRWKAVPWMAARWKGYLQGDLGGSWSKARLSKPLRRMGSEEEGSSSLSSFLEESRLNSRLPRPGAGSSNPLLRFLLVLLSSIMICLSKGVS